MLQWLADEIIKNKSVSKKNIVSRDKINACYNHPTFIVDDLYDYIRIVSLIDKVRDHPNDRENTMSYRGMEDEAWRIMPSLMVNDLLDQERHMIDDFITARPADFSECKGDFELLAKMQHYGLPTRLIDFTYNPLVALFFACSKTSMGTEKVNGRVVCHLSEDFFTDTRRIADVVCSMYKYYYDSALKFKIASLKKFWKENRMNMQDYFNFVFNECKSSIICKPPYFSQRHINQQCFDGLPQFYDRQRWREDNQ